MTEKLQAQADVVLFGKSVEDVSIKAPTGTKAADKPGFARIYGFSFGGAYYEMGAATLMLVHGPGVDAVSVPVPGPGLDDDDPFYKSLKCWTYAKSTQTTRLDVDSGTFEEVLLSEAAAEGGMGMSGARVSGARVSGARVSGARVSGARVSGARISGARLSGARDASD